MVAASPESAETPSARGRSTGFLLASVAFQRAKKLQLGARPRVDAVGHKPTRVAVLEVLAGAVSWTTQS